MAKSKDTSLGANAAPGASEGRSGTPGGSQEGSQDSQRVERCRHDMDRKTCFFCAPVIGVIVASPVGVGRPEAVITARFDSDCPSCGGGIEADHDKVGLIEGEWVCQQCWGQDEAEDEWGTSGGLHDH